MTAKKSQKNRILLAAQSTCRKQRSTLSVIAAMAGAAVITHTVSQFTRTPMHTSILTGQIWLNELLAGHPERFRRQMGMARRVFRKLSRELRAHSGLCNSKHVTADEMLAMFCYLARTGASNRDMQERFQRGGETVSKAIHRILHMLVSRPFYSKYLKLPDSSIPPEIRNNPKLWPFFKDAIGALDGSHVDIFVPDDALPRYRNRKGGVSQNVLAACNFFMLFLYILAGWEGSAADSQIFEYARSKDFAIPEGKYYLADAGFPNCDALLVPYRGKRYHLKEWGRSNQRPADREELFNLRHAQARNVVERIFGVTKRRFGLMIAAPEYDAATQAKFVPALCALHNFIRIHDPDDQPDEDKDDRPGANSGATQLQEDPPLNTSIEVSGEERDRASIHRDEIAQAMWDDYQRVLRERIAIIN